MSTIFESPDSGKTIYARTPGSGQRIKVSESDSIKQQRRDLEERQLWESIRKESKNNRSLREAMDRVIMIYHLSQDNKDGQK